jgi:hypothetical protein
LSLLDTNDAPPAWSMISIGYGELDPTIRVPDRKCR